MSMRWFERAFICLRRGWRHRFLLGLTILMMGILLVVAMVMQSASQAMKTRIWQQVPPFVYLSWDFEWQSQDWASEFEKLTGIPASESHYFLLEELDDFLQNSSGIKSVNALGNQHNLQFDLPDGISWSIASHTHPIPPIVQLGASHFQQGRYFSESEMVPGSFSNPVPALIPSHLAHSNGLSVGDTFFMSHFSAGEQYNPGSLPWTEREQEIIRSLRVKLEIVGIYWAELGYLQDDFDDHNPVFLETGGQIIIPDWANTAFNRQLESRFTEAWGEEGRAHLHTVWVNTLIILGDPLYLESFMAALESQLPEMFQQTSFVDFYSWQLAPIETLGVLSSWIFGGTTVAVFLMVAFLTFYFLKERRHELGLYLALGERKRKIIAQMGLEILLVFSLAMSLAFMVGQGLSNEASQQLLRLELLNQPLDFETESALRLALQEFVIDTGVSPQELSFDSLAAAMDISLTFKVILQLFVKGIFATSVSLAVSLFFLFKLDVKRILL